MTKAANALPARLQIHILTPQPSFREGGMPRDDNVTAVILEKVAATVSFNFFQPLLSVNRSRNRHIVGDMSTTHGDQLPS